MSDISVMPEDGETRLVCQPHERLKGKAPDGSTLEFLIKSSCGNSVICTFAPNAISIAQRHVDVEEIWFILQGNGKMWLKPESATEIYISLQPGTALTIPEKGSFQVKNESATETLTVLCTTMPPWNSQHNGVTVDGPWQPR